MSVGEKLQLRQSLFRNRVMYVTESYVGFGTDEQVTMGSAALSVFMAVGWIMPESPQMLEAIND